MRALLATTALLAAALAVPGVATAGILRKAAGEVDQACTPYGSILWLISAPLTNEACGQLYGYVGHAAFKPCQPPGPVLVGIPRLVMQTAHDAAKDTPACQSTLRDQVNATIVLQEALLPLVDEACTASGGGDPSHGLCSPIYVDPGFGSVRDLVGPVLA